MQNMLFMLGARFFNSSRFDELLDNECDIQRILDESTLLQDLMMPACQDKLFLYLVKNPQYVMQLMEHLTLEDEEVSSKYPFLASEIMSKEHHILQEYLFNEPNQVSLNMLFSVIQKDSLEPTLGSYFAKAVLPIIRKNYNLIWDYMSPKILSNLIKHLDVLHISEVVEKLILPDSIDQMTDVMRSLKLLSRVMKVAQHLHSEKETMENCLAILNAIVTRAQQLDCELIKPLVDIILDARFFLNLAYQCPKAQVYQLIASLLHYEHRQDNPQKFLEFLQIAAQMSNALRNNDVMVQTIQTTYGEIIQPFTTSKLLLLQVYWLLVLTREPDIIRELVNNNSFQVITNLVFSTSFNNQAIIQYEKIVNIILENDNELQAQAVPFLIKTILTLQKQRKQSFGDLKTKITAGYSGIVTRLSNTLVSKVHKLNDTEWQTYVSTTLLNINTIEQRFLCDIDPKQRQQYPTTQQQAQIQSLFSQHQLQQAQVYSNDENNDDEDDNEDDGDGDDNFQDCNEPMELPVTQEMADVDEAVHDPATSSAEFAQLIEQELESELKVDMVELEKKTDSQVNEYWNCHEPTE